jgi:hypothetical protein
MKSNGKKTAEITRISVSPIPISSGKVAYFAKITVVKSTLPNKNTSHKIQLFVK